MVAVVSACAALEPPLRVSGAGDAPRPEHQLGLDLVEGRSNGLLVRLRSTSALPEGPGALELYRRVDDEEPTLYQTIEITPQLSEALASDGVDFLDRGVQPGHRYAYFSTAVYGEDAVGESDVVVVQWQEPPARPEQLEVRAWTQRAVELSWPAAARQGAVVFRRDVLQQGAPLERLAEIGPSQRGVFVDHDVEPGAVYSYRVALARYDTQVVQYGAPSEAIYVDVPTAKREK